MLLALLTSFNPITSPACEPAKPVVAVCGEAAAKLWDSSGAASTDELTTIL